MVPSQDNYFWVFWIILESPIRENIREMTQAINKSVSTLLMAYIVAYLPSPLLKEEVIFFFNSVRSTL
jgi:hypothetical protein